MERERVFQFLVGLNLEFDQASGQVLGREPFPSMDEAFAQVRREECRKELMVGNYRNPIPEIQHWQSLNPFLLLENI